MKVTIADEAQKIIDEYGQKMERNGRINSMIAFVATMVLVFGTAAISLAMLLIG